MEQRASAQLLETELEWQTAEILWGAIMWPIPPRGPKGPMVRVTTSNFQYSRYVSSCVHLCYVSAPVLDLKREFLPSSVNLFSDLPSAAPFCLTVISTRSALCPSACPSDLLRAARLHGRCSWRNKRPHLGGENVSNRLPYLRWKEQPLRHIWDCLDALFSTLAK